MSPVRVLLGAAAAGALPGVTTGLRQNPSWRSGGLLNPDSAMRLVRIDDMLAAGRMLHAVMRDGSGQGTVLHWSHLLDGLLLLLAVPLAPWFGWHEAVNAAGVAAGPLSLAVLGAAVAWAAAPVAQPGWLWLGAFAAGAAPMLRSYGLLGVVHHHVLLAACVAMAAGAALRLLRGGAPVPGGLALGGWMAAGLWLSPETLPYTLMAAGAVWVGWLATPAPRLAAALLVQAAAFLGLTLLALAADPPVSGWWEAEPDRLSLPFAILAAGGLATAAAALPGRRWLPPLCAAICAAGWLAAFPQVLHGTAGLMTAAQAAAFFPGIVEMAPVGSVGQAADLLTGGVLAIGVLAGFAWRGRHAARRWTLGYAILCCVAALVVACLHVRFAAYPELCGALALPVLLSVIAASKMPAARQSLARLAAIAVLIGAPALRAVLPGSANLRQAAAHGCDMDGAVRLLAADPGAIVLADPDDTPELLYRTRVRTVGSLYHRNPQAFIRLRDAWRAIPREAPGQEWRATGAQLALACPGAPRSVVVAGAPATTLLDRLDANRPPGWLKRVSGSGGYVLYQAAW